MGQNADFRFVYDKFKKPSGGVFYKNCFPKGGGKFIKSGNGEIPERIKIFRRGGFAVFRKFVVKPSKAFGNFAFAKIIVKSGGKFLSVCAGKFFAKLFKRVYNLFAKGVELFKLFGVLRFDFTETFGASAERFKEKFSANVPDKAIVFKFRRFFRRNGKNSGF
jgi:hypothetical protein